MITSSFYIWLFFSRKSIFFQGLEPRLSCRKIIVCDFLGRWFGFPLQTPPPWEQHCWRIGEGGFVCCCFCIQGLVCWATSHCPGQCMFYFPVAKPSPQWKWCCLPLSSYMTLAKLLKGWRGKGLVFVEDLSCVGSSSEYQHYKVKKTPVPAQRQENKQGTQTSAVQCKILCPCSWMGHLGLLWVLAWGQRRLPGRWCLNWVLKDKISICQERRIERALQTEPSQ